MPPDGLDRDDVTHTLDRACSERSRANCGRACGHDPRSPTRRAAAHDHRRCHRRDDRGGRRLLGRSRVTTTTCDASCAADDHRRADAAGHGQIHRRRLGARGVEMRRPFAVHQRRRAHLANGCSPRIVIYPSRATARRSKEATSGQLAGLADHPLPAYPRHTTDVQVLRFPHITADGELARPFFVDARSRLDPDLSRRIGTRALYRTVDGGTTWSLLSTRQGIGQLSVRPTAERGASRDSEEHGDRHLRRRRDLAIRRSPEPTSSHARLACSRSDAQITESLIVWGGSHIAGSQYRSALTM